jgi:glycosyltransferase involved in cell wall biosynthesis
VNVLFVNHTGLRSGAEESLLSLMAALPSEVTPTLACPPGPLATAAAGIGVQVVWLPEIEGSMRLHPTHTPRAVFALARSALSIRRIARRTGADIVHANSIRAGLSATLAARWGGPPTIVHIRDCLPRGAASAATKALISRGSAMMIANSHYTAERFLTRGARPIRAIHNPVDLERYAAGGADRAEARADLGLGADQTVLGVIGQLTPWKGQETAIRALARVMRSEPRTTLLLIGEARFVSGATRYDNTAYVQNLRELTGALGLGDAVRFVGHRDDVPDVLAALDIALLPSWEEPFGRVVVEAMASGTPVIATAVGGPTEIIEEGINGLLVPPREPELWADAVTALIEDRQLRERIASEGRRTAAGFSTNRHVAQVVDVYRQVVGRSS